MGVRVGACVISRGCVYLCTVLAAFVSHYTYVGVCIVVGLCLICVVPPDDIPIHTFIPYHSSKTPGGRLVYLYTKKRGSVPRCGDCGNKLRGVSCQRYMA